MTSSAPSDPPPPTSRSRSGRAQIDAEPSATAPEHLGDGSRFDVQRTLGQGASGTVYQAFDRVRGAVLAVKSLSNAEPAALFAFKSEFRTLVGLSHPNLLQLHELVSSAGHWLLTMELVEGGDFLRYVRPEFGADGSLAREREGNSNDTELLATSGLTGREPQLAALRAALRRARGSRAQLVFVAGRSGMGKSALVNTFLDTARSETCLILCGRCYEREQLPYKAFDPLLDALSTYLLGLGDELVRGLLPQGTEALRCLFPVLDRVPAVRELQRRGVPNAEDIRRQAFCALRELCRNLSRNKPLLLYVDDLQWGDLDSAALFLELLREPEAPPLLLLCAHRSEEQDQSPLLRLFAGDYLQSGGVASPERIEVNPLVDSDSRALALALLGDIADAPTIAAKIAREARGTYALAEIALYSGTGVEEALARVQREWKPSVYLRQVKSVRVELLWLRGRLALALAARTQRAELYDLARQCAHAIEREAVTWALPYSRLLEAAAFEKADRTRALELLRQAANLAAAVDMKLLSAVAFALVARLEDAAEAKAREEAAHANVRDCGVACPERFVRMLAPGFRNA